MTSHQQQTHDELYGHAMGGGVVKTDKCTGEVRHIIPQYTGSQAQLQPQHQIIMHHQQQLQQQTQGTGGYKYVQLPMDGGKVVSPCAPVEQPCQARHCVPRERKTECYTCGPRRPDCYPDLPQCYGPPLYSDGFDSFEVTPKIDSRWNYFIDDTTFVADDGKFKVSVTEGLILTSTSFEKTWPKPEEDEEFWGGKGSKARSGKKGSKTRGLEDSDPNPKGFLDHFKTLPILNSEFSIPECGQLFVQANMANRVMNGDKHPFHSDVVPDGCNDFRLGYSGLCMIDFESGLLLTHAITNDAHYAIYEVLPFDREEGDCCATGVGKASFGSVVCIGRRDSFSPQTDFADIGLAIDRRKGAIWYINGAEVHVQPNLGSLPIHERIVYHLPGTTKAIMPRVVHVGFGHFTMLDAFPAVGPATPESRTALVRLTNFSYTDPYDKNKRVDFVFEDAPREARLFDQGASLTIRRLDVQTRC